MTLNAKRLYYKVLGEALDNAIKTKAGLEEDARMNLDAFKDRCEGYEKEEIENAKRTDWNYERAQDYLRDAKDYEEVIKALEKL